MLLSLFHNIPEGKNIMKYISTIVAMLITTTLMAGDFHIENAKLNTFGKNGNIHATVIAGDTDKIIQSLFVEGVKRTEIHDMKLSDGMMTMSTIQNLKIKAGTTFEFKKGGRHIMLLGIQKKLNKPTVIITFTDGTKYSFTVNK